MHIVKQILKKCTPGFVLDWYYRVVAQLAAIIYGHPSKKMIIIGVTGTKGKSTTSNIIWKILTEAGHTVGLTGTINTRIGELNELNTNKMTMTGRFGLQRMLKKMVDAGCDVAIVETTSEGIKQYRHKAIYYDICAFTNLTPEHLESHGGFEQYKAAKMQLFHHLSVLPLKKIDDVEVPRVSIANIANEHGADFLAPGEHTKISVGREDGADIVLSDVVEKLNGTEFKVNGTPMRIPLLGEWNAENAVMAMSIANALGVSIEDMVESAAEIEAIPGRMEFIDEGQDFSVIVDYAYEPVSLRLLYEFCRKLIGPENKIITLISSTGGGRDVGRRKPNGQVAGELCDYAIVTDEDPYDDDPQEIIDMVAEGVAAAGKIEGENFWRILDRAEAIHKAIGLAEPGDVVLTTAKGAEQKMCIAGGKKIDWDDRAVARKAIQEKKESAIKKAHIGG